MAAQPIRISVSATADASGNAQIKQVLDNSRYLVLVFTGFTLGTGPGASWSMFLENDPVLFDLGSKVTLGPVLLNPMEQVTIKIAGLPAGAGIQGSFWCTAGASAHEVLPYFVSPARGNVLAAQPDKALPGSPFSVGVGNNVIITVTVDASAHAIEILPDSSFQLSLAASQSVYVQGHTTGVVMDTVTVPSVGATIPAGSIRLRVSPAVEEVIDIVFARVSQAGKVYVNEVLTDEVVTTAGNAYGSPLPVELASASTLVRQQVVPVDSATGLELPQAYDYHAYSAPAAGSAASASVTALPSNSQMLDTLIATVVQQSGGAFSSAVVVRDGPSGTGAIIAEFQMGCTATAGDKDKIAIQGLRLAGSHAHALTVEFQTGAAGVVQIIFMGTFAR